MTEFKLSLKFHYWFDFPVLVMPQRNFDAIDGEDRLAIADYVPGYDWIPGRFGPPPGIPKARKDEFDAMNDREYLYAFLKLSQEEKESLMVSEAERRRTFTAHWPIETIVKANDCAKEGFYYTGVADRVQCAFCGGIVRNWERGDVPKLQHKNFFNYCRMVQNKPCQNIPLNECGLPKELMTNQLSSNFRTDSKPATLGDLNINTVRPKDPSLSVFTKRKETYKRYSDSNPVPADKLCEAGFFYEGIGDKVKCFWCDGALEMWSKGDEPWMEHAKWYPGCTYVQQTKGLDFIRKARATMTPDNVHTADTLTYNKGDVAFLDVKIPEPEPELPVESKDGYKFCLSLGYRHEDIKEVYEANNNEEFDIEDQARLVGIVQELFEGNRESLEKFKEERSTQQKRETKSDGVEQMDTSTLPSRRINLPELITNPNEPSDKECKDILDAMKCKKCKTRLPNCPHHCSCCYGLVLFIVGWGSCPPLWMFLFVSRMQSRKPSYKVSGMLQPCEGGVSDVSLLTLVLLVGNAQSATPSNLIPCSISTLVIQLIMVLFHL
ncbi:hypothetical protein EB796_001346 [Bugula neritina]|uniref:Uncharacterized protein n=1 Tax=Bugula neritina TaxID=10212 RepID=A0A7J7KQK3_BUGNE|nr:hypothetical protein EB796_001346 [Bugula neritina]